MSIKHPQLDRRLDGGRDAWDVPAASAILLGDYFAAAATASGLVLAAGVLTQTAAPAGGDIKVYLNAGLLYGKTAPGGGDSLVRLTGGGLTTL